MAKVRCAQGVGKPSGVLWERQQLETRGTHTHTICAGSRRKGGSILQAKSCNVNGESKAISSFCVFKKKHSIGRTMSKPAERNRLNEDHGRKQSSSKLVLFSSFSSFTNACFSVSGIYATSNFHFPSLPESCMCSAGLF